jgi:phosphoribosylformylglycinamidine synthase
VELDELGGSEYYKTIFEATGANVPVVRFDLERSMIYAVIDAIDQGLVHACHDISNGGLAATVAEMALTRPAQFGFELDLDKAAEPEWGPGMRTDKILFSESAGFVIEAKQGSEKKLVEVLKGYGLDVMEIGKVTKARKIVMNRAGKTVMEIGLDEARKAWTTGLAEAMR